MNNPFPFLFLLHRVAHRVRQSLAAELAREDIDISPEEFFLLMFLFEQDGASVSDLSEWLGRDRTTLSRNADTLEKKGFIERRSGTHDRRRVQCFVTQKTVDLRTKMQEISTDLHIQLLSGIPDEMMVATSASLVQVEKTARARLQKS